METLINKKYQNFKMAFQVKRKKYIPLHDNYQPEAKETPATTPQDNQNGQGTIKRIIGFFSARAEWTVLAITLLLGGLFALYIHHLGLIKVFVDQTAHLNISRQVVDSMTPGISQFGFWPPLLHLVLVPFISIDYLYRTGLAGAFALIPFLCLATYFIYKLIFLFTGRKRIAFWGAVLFLLNPYLLYYAVTPMMEVLFVANLLGVAYFLALWMKYGRLPHLIYTALFVSISSVSRFEGLFLIILVGLIILAQLIKQKKKYHEIEALTILFYFVAALGVFFTLLYGWVFGSNPLAFLNSDWSAFSQQRDYFLPTENSIFTSLQYLLHASYYMIGRLQIAISVLSLIILLLFYRNSRVLSVGLVLASPFIFDWLSLYRGHTVIYVPELPPFGIFFNERYGLYWVGFTIFIPIVLANRLYPSLSRKMNLSKLWHLPGRFARTSSASGDYGNLADDPKADSGVIIEEKYRSTRTFAASFLVAMISLSNIFYFYQTSFAEKFRNIQVQNSERKDEVTTAGVLREKYDFGKILMTRAFNDYTVINAGIPLKNYIQESNYRFYDQTLVRPWIFARFVVMFNVQDDQESQWGHSSWVRKNEKVAAYWGKSKTFLEYYEVILETDSKKVFKIKEDKVRKYAKDRGYDLSEVPSINKQMVWWDPGTIYEDMNAAVYKNKREPNIDL